MFTPADAPLALVGYSSAVAQALRGLGITAIPVPAEHPADIIAACLTLRFAGALIAPAQQLAWFDAAQPDTDAKKVGRVDTLAFHGAAGTAGTFAYADALSDTIEDGGYAARGASLAIVGRSASDLAMAAPVVRLGFTDIGLVADSAPEAEKAIRDLPSGLRIFAMSRRDAAIKSLASRSDLLVLTAGELPAGILEPYHTLLDLTGRVKSNTSGASLLNTDNLQLFHLARQLYHATGQRFDIGALQATAEAMKADTASV